MKSTYRDIWYHTVNQLVSSACAMLKVDGEDLLVREARGDEEIGYKYLASMYPNNIIAITSSPTQKWTARVYFNGRERSVVVERHSFPVPKRHSK